MAAYTNDLRLKEIATGDESGTWGASTNTNLELIAEAFSFGTEAITTNADTHATTIADGSTDEGRSIYLKYTGTLDSACTITLGPNTVSKLWFIENGTSGSQNIIISQGSGANVTIPAGDVKAVYSDGAGSGAAIVDAFASLNVVDLKVEDDLTVTDDASVGGDLLVSGEVQTANIGFTDGDNAITIADGGGITAAAGITSTAASNTFGATSFNDENITNVGSIALDTITNDGTDITLDSSGDIILDVDGDNVFFKDGSSNFFSVSNVSGDAYLGVEQSDKDLLIRGNDGGSAFTALTFDMSAAGAATFNSSVNASGSIDAASSSSVSTVSATATGSANMVLGTNFSGSASQGMPNQSGFINMRQSFPMVFGVAETEHFRIDTSGNFSFGGGGNATNFSNYVTLDLRDSTGGIIDFSEASAGVHSRIQAVVNNSLNITNRQNFPLIFGTNDTERMRITGGGQILIGSSFTSPVGSETVLQAAGNSLSGGVAGFYDPDVSVSAGNVILQLTFTVDQDCTNGKFVQFSDGNTNCGSITAASATSVAYNTTSDERLKKNIVDASSQLDVIKNIKVREFDWKTSNKHDIGMIAQELYKVIPNVVTEGSDEHEMNWGVDYGKLTPYLVKAVQELSATIDELKTEIQTLKGE